MAWTLLPRGLAVAAQPASPFTTPRSRAMALLGEGLLGLLPVPRRVWRSSKAMAAALNSEDPTVVVAPDSLLAVSSRAVSGERMAGAWLSVPRWRPGEPRDVGLCVAGDLLRRTAALTGAGAAPVPASGALATMLTGGITPKVHSQHKVCASILNGRGLGRTGALMAAAAGMERDSDPTTDFPDPARLARTSLSVGSNRLDTLLELY